MVFSTTDKCVAIPILADETNLNQLFEVMRKGRRWKTDGALYAGNRQTIHASANQCTVNMEPGRVTYGV